jgi:hypothetical protein
MPRHSSGLRENLTTSLGVNWRKQYNKWQSFEVEKHSPYMYSAEFVHISDEVHVTSLTLTLKNSRNHSLLHVTGNFPRPGIQVGMFTFFQSSSNSIRLAFRISCAIKWLVVCNPSRKKCWTGIGSIPADGGCRYVFFLALVCIRRSCVMQSPYAYGDQFLSPYAYGDHKDNRMHMGIAWHEIPNAYGDQDQSPYAYGDQVNPRMHTGIKWIPVCIRGLHVMRSPYAYRD